MLLEVMRGVSSVLNRRRQLMLWPMITVPLGCPSLSLGSPFVALELLTRRQVWPGRTIKSALVEFSSPASPAAILHAAENLPLGRK